VLLLDEFMKREQKDSLVLPDIGSGAGIFVKDEDLIEIL